MLLNSGRATIGTSRDAKPRPIDGVVNHWRGERMGRLAGTGDDNAAAGEQQ